MITIPARGPKLRWLVILCGIFIFLWMSPEDQHVWPVAMLGTSAAILSYTWWISGSWGGHSFSVQAALPIAAISGLIIGISSSVITALLMFMKNARHSHFTPDFPTEQIAAILERAPIWGMAGALTGLGLGLLLISIGKTDTT